MKEIKTDSTRTFLQAWKAVPFIVVLIFFATPSFGQNTKGDKPASQSPIFKFPKIKSKSKGRGDHAVTGDISGRRRIRTKNASSASHAVYSNANPKGKQWRTKGGAEHSRVPKFKSRIKSESAQRAKNNVYPQRGRYVHNPSRKPRPTKVFSKPASGNDIVRSNPSVRQRAWTGNLKGGRVGAPSVSRPYITRGRKNVYWGKFSKGERPVTRDLTGRPVRTKNFHSSAIGTGRSDTMKFARRKPSREGSRSSQFRGGYSSISGQGGQRKGNISGDPLRSRNPHTSQNAGRNNAPAVFKSIRPGNGKLPVRQPGIGGGGIGRLLKKLTGNPSPPGGAGLNDPGSYRGNGQPKLIAGGGAGGYRGDSKGRRPDKGGGSISSQLRGNNKGRSIGTRPPAGSWGMGKFQGNVKREDLLPGFRDAGVGYSGNFKSSRPLKGGGSVSGRFFNNKGRALNTKLPGGSWAMGKFRGSVSREELLPAFKDAGVGYSGNFKRSRPLKGGGSVSGQFFNNKGRPINVRPPGGSWALGKFQGNVRREDLLPGFKDAGVGYSGNIKSARPSKGGGSISGRFLGNGGRAIDVKPPAPGSRAVGGFRGSYRQDELWTEIRRGVGGYSGDLKGKKPAKGGGSISGRLWNNNEKPLVVRGPSDGAGRAYGFSGTTRLSRFRKNYIRNPHANEEALKKARPNPTTYAIGGLTGKTKRPSYVQNPNANDASLKKLKPGGSTFDIGGITTKEKRPSYVKNPNANEKSLKKLRPHPSTFAVGGLTSKTLSPEYARNPSSNKNALRTFAPGKAYAQIKDYQGNQRMRKYNDSRFHPDSQFAHGNQDNVKNERSLKTNIKLMWAKIFKKQDGQPDIVKEKPHVPRYDKKEKDLWKALYD